MACSEITRAESQVVLSVARCTFGFHKEQAPISISWLEGLTSLPRRTVTRCMSSLQSKNVISPKGRERIKGQLVTVWKINPVSTWKVGTQTSLEVGTPQSLLNAPGRDPSGPKVGTVGSPIKERKKEPTTEERAFLLNSKFFSKDKKLTEDPEAFINAWKDARPDLDILQSLKKADAYLLSTTKKYKNYAQFFTNWINRERANSSNPKVLSEEEHLAEIEADARRYGVPL